MYAATAKLASLHQHQREQIALATERGYLFLRSAQSQERVRSVWWAHCRENRLPFVLAIVSTRRAWVSVETECARTRLGMRGISRVSRLLVRETCSRRPIVVCGYGGGAYVPGGHAEWIAARLYDLARRYMRPEPSFRDDPPDITPPPSVALPGAGGGSWPSVAISARNSKNAPVSCTGRSPTGGNVLASEGSRHHRDASAKL